MRRLRELWCRVRGHEWGVWCGGWPTHLIEWNTCGRCGAERTRRSGR